MLTKFIATHKYPFYVFCLCTMSISIGVVYTTTTGRGECFGSWDFLNVFFLKRSQWITRTIFERTFRTRLSLCVGVRILIGFRFVRSRASNLDFSRRFALKTPRWPLISGLYEWNCVGPSNTVYRHRSFVRSTWFNDSAESSLTRARIFPYFSEVVVLFTLLFSSADRLDRWRTFNPRPEIPSEIYGRLGPVTVSGHRELFFFFMSKNTENIIRTRPRNRRFHYVTKRTNCSKRCYYRYQKRKRNVVIVIRLIIIVVKIQ